MNSKVRPLFYIILGAPDSDRRAVLVDLITDGLGEGEKTLVFLNRNEAPGSFNQSLGETRPWLWEDGTISADVPESISDASGDALPEERYSHVFFVAEGARNPVDQIEAIKAWITPLDVEFARIITVINCTLASQHRELTPWWDACVHFSDVVLLSRRHGVPNKWMSDFQERFRTKFIPALFELVKEGRVKNPALILEPHARRMTQVFDREDADWDTARRLAPEAEIEFEVDDEADEENDGRKDSEEDGPVTEAYFERRANGSRVVELPDIGKYLGSA